MSGRALPRPHMFRLGRDGLRPGDEGRPVQGETYEGGEGLDPTYVKERDEMGSTWEFYPGYNSHMANKAKPKSEDAKHREMLEKREKRILKEEALRKRK